MSDSKAVGSFLVAEFEQEIATTTRVIAAVPESGLGYSPDSKSKSALGLMRHLALEDTWLLNSVADGVVGPPPDEGDVCGIANSADAVARYTESVSAALGRVKGMSAEELDKVIDFFGIMQMPAVNLLSMALKHSLHHRGQLSAYIRATGGKVPGIYGPSGDM